MSALLPASGIEAATWLKDALIGFASDVVSIVPSGYPAYARLLHPAYRSSTDEPTRASWQSVADLAGLAIDKTIQWEDVIAPLPEQAFKFFEPPLEGTLDQETCEELMPILKAHTSTPSLCWYGVWDGYSYLREACRNASRISLNGRRYYLLRGALPLSPASLCTGPFFQWANIFWPDDRAWCVASEVDFRSTYIAASVGAIVDLLARFPGEVFRVDPNERVTLRGSSKKPDAGADR